LRLRPSSFPTIRIAQWASFLQKAGDFFTLALQATDIEKIVRILSVTASEYWSEHYLFEKSSAHRIKILGLPTIHLLIINFLVPFLFVYGNEKDIPSLRERSIGFLDQIPGEKNELIDRWKELGLSCDTALKSQALTQLKTNYCDKKRCLHCRIGLRLLK
jgi:hypothetical protein